MDSRIIRPEEIRKILLRLPNPVACYISRDGGFEIYRAKDLHNKQWNSPALKSIAILCRHSYSRYGNRPAIDVVDPKAAVYLVRATYPGDNPSDKIEEWLSVRMVPGDGEPRGVFEPEIYRFKGKSVDHWMKKKLGARGFWEQVASSSRMCGIHPYRVRKDGALVFLKDPRHRFTALCFALMHVQFEIDHPLDKFPYRHITAIIRPDFYEKGLRHVDKHGRAVRPFFVPAHKFLGGKRDDIVVQRDIYSYQFPLYWFNGDSLLAFVNGLRKERGMVPLKAVTSRMFAALGGSNDRPVTVAGLRTTPAKMRELMDRALSDYPELQITQAASWYRGMKAVVRAGRVIKLQSAAIAPRARPVRHPRMRATSSH